MGKPRFGRRAQGTHGDPQAEALSYGNAFLEPFDGEAGAKGWNAVRSQGARAHGRSLLRKNHRQ
jgi:hypothetical protein